MSALLFPIFSRYSMLSCSTSACPLEFLVSRLGARAPDARSLRARGGPWLLSRNPYRGYSTSPRSSPFCRVSFTWQKYFRVSHRLVPPLARSFFLLFFVSILVVQSSRSGPDAAVKSLTRSRGSLLKATLFLLIRRKAFSDAAEKNR